METMLAAMLDPLTWCSAIAVAFIMRPDSIWKAVGIAVAINLVAGALIIALEPEGSDPVAALVLAAVATTIWTAGAYALRRLLRRGRGSQDT